ncbi:hypothetical protein MHUMG1_09299 [Metarhizium humberi]|uniref:Major facilitator superfamily domain, general substrate transporter n=1 Tax=Metarhizium humberi TaxID=2596975 RepID=A0A9P8M3W8_9HYPO|nr:hypothetical protein MHUMG1_09299 [Metarhizium humberi]
MTDKYTYMEGVDTSAAVTAAGSRASRNGAEPAENEPSAGGILRNDGAAVEAQKTTEKPDQVHLMATRPNGGWKAWLQTYYTANFHFDPSRASLIGGIQTFLVFFASGAGGPLYDAGYTRFLVTAGAILIVFGTMMQSLCTEYWQFILAESFCIGLGGGLTSFLGPAVLSTYFTSRYPLTVGIAASGTGIGGIILPIVFRELQPKIGFPWTVRVIGFILFATLMLPVFFLRPRLIPGAGRKAIDKTAFTDWPFAVFLIGNFIYLLGGFTPFFYIQVYAVEKNIADASLSFYIISIMNAVSAIGRILPNFLSPYTGPFNMLIFTSILTFVFAFAFEGAQSVGSLIVVSALYGGATGLFFALQPVVVIGLSPNPKLTGTRVGMAFCFLSFAVLASNPIAGAIQTAGGFSGVWIWTGVVTAVGTAIMFAARLIKTEGQPPFTSTTCPVIADEDFPNRNMIASVTSSGSTIDFSAPLYAAATGASSMVP